MSHFTVLVVGDVEHNLAPFHEFECTGRNDEFVVNVDQLDEAKQEYAKGTIRRLRDPEGGLHDPYEDRFYRDPTPEETAKIGIVAGTGCGNGMSWTSKDWGDGKGYSTKVHSAPEGWEDVEVPRSEVMTLREFIEYWYERPLLGFTQTPDLEGEHKYGWYQVDVDGNVDALIDRTNPNRKWDWYQIGGRWSGFLKLKPGAAGSDGERSWTNRDEPNKVGWVDSARKGDIDFAGMRDEAGAKAAERWGVARQDRGGAGETWTPWKECFLAAERDHAKAKDAYWSQAPVAAMSEGLKARGEFPWGDMDEYLLSREAYVQKARDGAISTFAFCQDRKWVERGQMGWWACVSDEKDTSDWGREFAAHLDALPDDALISIVDCHI
jgi:hypothetical protein